LKELHPNLRAPPACSDSAGHVGGGSPIEGFSVLGRRIFVRIDNQSARKVDQAVPGSIFLIQ